MSRTSLLVLVGGIAAGALAPWACGGDGGTGCPAGEEECAGVCVDTDTDHSHCGGCGNACPAGTVCSGGECSCSGGLELCGTTCTNTQGDNANCGTCGNACPSGQNCIRGACTSVCTPTGDESCNNRDDDCDTTVDESVTRPCDNACGPGTQTCTAGVWGTCSAPTPGTETCNGEDDDCDGQTDEGVGSTYYHDGDSDAYGDPSDPRQACTPPAGYVTTNTDCNDADAAVHPGATEVCNVTKDAAGAGTTDEGCTCTPVGATENCGEGGDTGACEWGSRTCEAGGWSACTGGIRPLPEACDTIDNDCDGATDEGMAEDPYEVDDTCAQASPLPRADEGWPGDPPTVVADAMLYSADASPDVDWFTIEAAEAVHLDCPIWPPLQGQCYFYLDIALKPPAGADHALWRMCVYGGETCEALGDEFCTEAADWIAADGAYEMSLTWEGVCGLDDSWTFRVKVQGTGSSTWACTPYELDYGFYFDGGYGEAYCGA